MSSETEDNSPLINNRHDSELSNETPIIDAIPVLKDTNEESSYVPPAIAAAATAEQLGDVKETVEAKVEKKAEDKKEASTSEQKTPAENVLPVARKKEPKAESEDKAEESKDEETSPLIPPATAPSQDERSTTSSIVPFVPDDLGRESVEITCPYCKNKGMTNLSQEMSFMTLMFTILSLVIFPFALFALCCTKKVSIIFQCL